MKMKKFLALCLSLVAALGMTFAAASCGDTNNSSNGTQNSVPEGMVKFEFTVQYANGEKVANALVAFCNEGCTMLFTDENGYVSTTVEDKEGWYAHVEGVSGYEAPWFYADQEESNSYTFVLTEKAESTEETE